MNAKHTGRTTTNISIKNLRIQRAPKPCRNFGKLSSYSYNQIYSFFFDIRLYNIAAEIINKPTKGSIRLSEDAPNKKIVIAIPANI
jgi:hypothetical protein